MAHNSETVEQFPSGVEALVAALGLRYSGRDDAVWLRFAPGTQAAGVLTQSHTAAAPVLWCRRQLKHGRARGLLVNAGQANAFTGVQGDELVVESAKAVAAAQDCREDEVFLASTGVIGEPVPWPPLKAALGSPAAWRSATLAEAAGAITTTDTRAKTAVEELEFAGETMRIAGFAKGSGMIAPNMATMLAFVVTDAVVETATLQTLVALANERSFNCLTVDGDSSTNDTLLAFATGSSGVAIDVEDRVTPFLAAIERVMIDLARQVARDGEGARKLLEVQVSGARRFVDARQVGLSVAASPLVKTAVAAEDPNWGRIVMAVGKAGVPLDARRLEVRINDCLVACDGARPPNYDEAEVARAMKADEILIEVCLSEGEESATVWGCDMTAEYVAINASYRS